MKKRLSWRTAVIVGVAVSAGVAYLVVTTKGSGLLLRPDSASVVAEGSRIYEANCASCHGENLEGQPDWKTPLASGRMPAPPHDKNGHTWHHREQMLFEITKSGLQKFAGKDYQTDMPSYDGVLTDEEIIAVLSYIKSTWPAEIRARHDELSLRDPDR